MNKFGAKRAVSADGIVFDSKHEMRRWDYLRLLQRAGDITELQRQVPYLLVPEQREKTFEVYSKGEKKGELKEGRLLERKVEYIADFQYRDKHGKLVVEDAKGLKKGAVYAVFVIKRKLMLHRYGIRVVEV